MDVWGAVLLAVVSSTATSIVTILLLIWGTQNEGLALVRVVKRGWEVIVPGLVWVPVWICTIKLGTWKAEAMVQFLGSMVGGISTGVATGLYLYQLATYIWLGNHTSAILSDLEKQILRKGVNFKVNFLAWSLGLGIWGLICDIVVLYDRKSLANTLCLLIDLGSLFWTVLSALLSHLIQKRRATRKNAMRAEEADRAANAGANEDAQNEAAASSAKARQAIVELNKVKKASVQESIKMKEQLNRAANDIKKLTEQLAKLKKDTEEEAARKAVEARASEHAAVEIALEEVSDLLDMLSLSLQSI
jgi:hypothetical protein